MYLMNPYFEIVRVGITPWDNVSGQDILKVIESDGRKCYKSEDKTTQVSATKFVKDRMVQQHTALLDGIHMTAEFITDRGISHEWIRHKLTEIIGTNTIDVDWTPMSVVQESTRYCNYMKKGHVVFIIPPWISSIPEGDYTNLSSIDIIRLTENEALWFKHRLTCERVYNKMIINGWTPQQARCDLLIGVKTEFRVTCSLTEWRHVFKQRTSFAAHPQMFEIMRPLLTEVKGRIPIIFDDITW